MLEDIKQRHNAFPLESGTDIMFHNDISFLLQELEKLQQENERYKKTLRTIERDSAIYEELCRETLKT